MNNSEIKSFFKIEDVCWNISDVTSIINNINIWYSIINYLIHTIRNLFLYS